MKFLKINKLKTMFGQCDYKGLDIDLFVPGGQVYDKDATRCLVVTEAAVIPNHPDVTELTEAEYVAARQEIISEIEAAAASTEVDIEELKNTQAQVVFALVMGGLM